MSITTFSHPGQAQRHASSPQRSVWVAANAGTGKTKVLTDRVLRLLLGGAKPSHILCMTYTNAAAAEMKNRVQQTLREWMLMDDEALKFALSDLGIESASNGNAGGDVLLRARRLFAEVLDAPEGVRITTIHAFCQMILRRFPIEAGVTPHFEVVDERTACELLAEAQQRLLARRQAGAADAVSLALGRLAAHMSDQGFGDVLQQMVKDRRYWSAALEQGGVDALIQQMCAAVGVDQDEVPDALLLKFSEELLCRESELRSSIKVLEKYGDKQLLVATSLEDSLNFRSKNVGEWWRRYQLIFLVDKGTARVKSVWNEKGFKERYGEAAEWLAREAIRVEECLRRLYVAESVQITRDLMMVAGEIFCLYREIKSFHDFLDYDDLIERVEHLLCRDRAAEWVLFKLDGGVDHLLVDEAQDTSPQQWRIVEALVQEFFAGQGRRSAHLPPRTLFVVGDEKQSIYSFQGAEPRGFAFKRRDFERSAKNAGLEFAVVPLETSFRSTDAVLQVVDQVYADPAIREHVSFLPDVPVLHATHRTGMAGRVELWPVATSAEKPEVTAWTPWELAEAPASAVSTMAERIASTIAGWLAQGDILPSKGRAIRPGDIMILVTRRNALMEALVRALKAHRVPLAGVDRIALLESLAVQDLLALTEFLLLPDDDLSLACVLKSPLCGLDEEALYQLAYGRDGQTLWQVLQAKAREPGAPTGWKAAHHLLHELLAMVDFIPPYELLNQVLECKGGRVRLQARLGVDAVEPVEELLALALDYERTHTPSLQGFLHWLRASTEDVKRDMEQTADAVRIMTVHGAKGLQAPIVILPDTLRKPASELHKRPLWDKGDETHRPCVFWLPRGQKMLSPHTERLEARRRAEALAEQRRLLYVAMTRAEDRLYVVGAARGKASEKMLEGTWYALVENALRALGAASVPVPYPTPDGVKETALVYATPQRAAVATREEALALEQATEIPDFLCRVVAVDPYPPRPLAPSRADELSSRGSADILSPVSRHAQLRRGVLVHAMLEFLPDVATAAQAEAATSFLRHQAVEWKEAERQALVAEVLAVLHDPAFARVFGQGSLAEVPVSGVVELDGAPRLINGQMDRLFVAEDGVWVVDYKTNREAPATVDAVPEAYRQQMALYRQVLSEIYPGRPIHAALLWTSAPSLMVLPDAIFATPSAKRLTTAHAQG